MLTITPIKFNNLFNLQIKKQEQNTQKTQENSNAQMMAYPAGYYLNNIAFGLNNEELKNIFREYDVFVDDESFQKISLDIQNKLTNTGYVRRNIQYIKDHFARIKDEKRNTILTPQTYLKSCVDNPKMFTLPPIVFKNKLQYIEDHFASIQDEKGKPILTKERYLQSCLKNPSLFTLEPKLIKGNYALFNSYFGDVKDENGKSINYLEAALYNPSIFTIPLDDLKQKVRLLIAAENYTYDEALQDVLKNPQSPIMDYD